MKVFISYSTAADQIIALRLQTIAAVYGMTIYVPPATTRHVASPELIPEVQRQLNESDVVLAVITHEPVSSAISEMNWALASGKLLIPIVSPGVPQEYYARFEPYFIVNLADPSQTEQQIVRFLAEKHESEKGKTALIGLAIFATALLLFGADSK
ncbi:MAG: hypothetical protein ABSA59_07860 [Terriglobia bacterium]|jgi:hypothetical protein